MADVPTVDEHDAMTIVGKGAVVLLWSHAVLSPHADLPRFCAYHESNMAHPDDFTENMHESYVQSTVITLGKLFQAATLALTLEPPTTSTATPAPTLTAELSKLPALSRAARTYVGLALDEIDAKFPQRFLDTFFEEEDHGAMFEATVVISQRSLDRHSDSADPVSRYRFLGQFFGGL